MLDPTELPSPDTIPETTTPAPITLADDTQTQTISLNDPGELRPPSDNVSTVRAEKAHYSLGEQSPGVDALKDSIAAGQEPDIRQKLSASEEYDNVRIKNQILQDLATQYGGNLPPEAFDIVYSLTNAELKTNPATVLERKFADKYITDITSTFPYWADVERMNQTLNKSAEVIKQDDTVGRNVATWHQYAVKSYEDLHNEWENSGLLYKGVSFVASLLPFLPWYRQAKALAERPTSLTNWGMGETVAENVSFLYRLPLEERIPVYERAIKYLKESGNLLDAMTLAQAMVSFSTSDRYLGNAVSLADYSTLGAPVLRLATRTGKTAKPILEETGKVIKNQERAPLMIEYQKPKLLEYQGSNKFTKQPDLFGEPVQGELFEGRDLGTQPILLRKGSQKQYRGPDGKMRSLKPAEPTEVSPTGIFRGPGGKFAFDTGSMKQLEMDLPLGPRQYELELIPPARPGPPIEPTAQQFKQVIADGLKALEGPTPPKVEEVLSSLGDTQSASLVGALKRFADVNKEGLSDVAEQIKNLLNGELWLRGSKVLHSSLVSDMGRALSAEGEKIVSGFLEALRVQRLTPEALAAGVSNAKKALAKDFARLGQAVRHIRYTPAEMHPGNVDTVSYIVGRTDGALFDSEKQALLYRDQHYNIGEAGVIRPQGNAWYIEIPKIIDETAGDVIQGLNVVKNRSQISDANILGRFLRTSKDLIAPFQSEARNVATHSPQKIQKQMRDIIWEKIGKLSSDERRRVSDMLVINRDTARVEGQQRGFWYRNVGEFEEAFLARHGRMPSQKEIIAYDTYRRMQDFELLLENVAVYRDKARLGIEQHRFSYDGGKTGWFESKRLEKFPWEKGTSAADKQDAGVWVQDSKTGKGTFYYKFQITAEERKLIDHMVENEGYRVLQVAEPRKHPLKGIAKTKAGDDLQEQVNYIVTNTLENKPLSWNQVEYREGPHSLYTHKYYISQPVIEAGRGGRLTYYGDNNALNVKTHAQAKALSEHLDNARMLLRDSKMDELRVYLANHTVFSMDQFLDLFRRSDSPFSVKHPIVFKERGKNTFDTVVNLKKEPGYRDMIDGNKNIHDLSNSMDKSFLMERNEVINTVNEKTWMLEPAMQFDPYVALNQVIGQRIRNVWSNDYKIGATMSWIKQFEHVMDPRSSVLTGHPLHFLFNPQYKKVGEAALGDLAAAKAARMAIINFIGAKSELAMSLDTFKMRLLDTVYKGVGDGKLLDMAIATTANPVEWMRATAFHSKLGLFNPVQMFLQANQMFHSIAVSGVQHGISGMTAAFLIRRLGHNPKALDAVAKVATKFGWKEAEFKEMYAAFQKTGLYEVAGEAALRDDVFDPHLFRSTFGHVLDSGAMFFNEGERMGRMTGFATAYKDFRKANPGKKLDNRAIQEILNRSDDLSGNMTVASKAAWQTGIWSIPTQFMTWNARMMEQLISRRLTNPEKLRMLASYSLLYGAPIGIGLPVAGLWPMHDSIKKEAMSRGINLNDGYFEPFTQGLAETAINYLTGHQYNVSQRYAPGNATQIRDALRGDKTIIQTLFGASGTIVGDFIKASAPFYYYTASVFTDTGEFPLQASDWMSVFRNISTIDNASKITAILAYKKWLTKTGTVVDNKVDGLDAAAVALGLTPMRIADTFLLRSELKEEAKDRLEFENRAVEALRRAYQAGGTGDYDAMRAYFKQARTIISAGDLNAEQENRAYSRAVKELYTLGDKVRWDAIKQAPRSQFQNRFDMYSKGSK